MAFDLSKVSNWFHSSEIGHAYSLFMHKLLEGYKSQDNTCPKIWYVKSSFLKKEKFIRYHRQALPSMLILNSKSEQSMKTAWKKVKVWAIYRLNMELDLRSLFYLIWAPCLQLLYSLGLSTFSSRSTWSKRRNDFREKRS
jgi:hypothetical protein